MQLCNRVTYGTTLLVNSRITFVVLDSQTKASWINVLVSPDEESTKDGLSEEVQDTVEDGL